MYLAGYSTSPAPRVRIPSSGREGVKYSEPPGTDKEFARPDSPVWNYVRTLLAPNESAVGFVLGSPTISRTKTSSKITYVRPKKAPKRVIAVYGPVRSVSNGRANVRNVQTVWEFGIYDGDPASGGTYTYTKKIDKTADYLGAIAMMAVGGALVYAAAVTGAAASGGAAASVAPSSASSVTASTGVTLSPATAAVPGASSVTAGGAGVASGASGLLKTAGAVYEAAQPIVGAAKAVYTAYDQIAQAKAAEKAADDEARIMEQFARDSAAMQWDAGAEHAAERATFGALPISVLLGGAAIFGALLLAKKGR